MINTVVPNQGTSLQDRAALRDVVFRHHPGTVIEILSEGKETVLCFRSGSGELFLALDYDLRCKSIEDVLASIANMLVCCHSCTSHGLRSFFCRSDYRLMSRRLREFLGVDGYQEFLAHAPISVGENEAGPVPISGVTDTAWVGGNA